jgi:hypothetical protein
MIDFAAARAEFAAIRMLSTLGLAVPAAGPLFGSSTDGETLYGRTPAVALAGVHSRGRFLRTFS